MYACFILFFLVKEVRNLYRHGRHYFSQFWNWVELLIIALSGAAAAMFAYRQIETNKLTAIFKETRGQCHLRPGLEGLTYQTG